MVRNFENETISDFENQDLAVVATVEFRFHSIKNQSDSADQKQNEGFGVWGRAPAPKAAAKQHKVR